jgi:hypothetical protein
MSADGAGFDWPAVATEDYLLLGALPPLLACMAYFSLVEATYFSLTPADRLGLRRTHPEAARRIEAILATPRVLLVSDMLGALVVSTTYLVVSTVLVSRFEHSLLLSMVIAVVSVLGMVLSAEVLPKIIGTTDRSRAALDGDLLHSHGTDCTSDRSIRARTDRQVDRPDSADRCCGCGGACCAA